VYLETTSSFGFKVLNGASVRAQMTLKHHCSPISVVQLIRNKESRFPIMWLFHTHHLRSRGSVHAHRDFYY